MSPTAPPNAPSAKPATHAAEGTEHKVSNFLRQIIEKDLAQGTYASRRWGGSPGNAAHHAKGQPDPAKIRTRFPPEPNGYLHVGHAKSICINFGLAEEYGGVCHLRFDDTNPEKEDTEYVNSIIDAVKWLGFSWNGEPGQPNADALPYQASDYFDFMYEAALYLIGAGLAYVDEQTPEQMRAEPRRLQHPRHRQPVPRPHPRREPDPLSGNARRQTRRRLHGLARQDRHGQPQHQPARPGHLPHPPRHPPQHRRQMVHLPDVHLRPPD